MLGSVTCFYSPCGDAPLGNVLINHEFGGAANGLGGVAALLGLILIAVANGWLGQE